MKLITLGFVLLLICMVLVTCGCLSSSQGIRADIINEEPNNYVSFSEDEMQRFPQLKKAIIEHGTYVDVSQTICHMVEGILRYFDTEYILYNNTYYEVGIWHAD